MNSKKGVGIDHCNEKQIKKSCKYKFNPNFGLMCQYVFWVKAGIKSFIFYVVSLFFVAVINPYYS